MHAKSSVLAAGRRRATELGEEEEEAKRKRCHGGQANPREKRRERKKNADDNTLDRANGFSFLGISYFSGISDFFIFIFITGRYVTPSASRRYLARQ
jgi:hypothetical protein